MNTTEINYYRTHAAMSAAQEKYLSDRTPENWNAYIAADKAHQPYSVEMSQLRMQQQIDGMSKSEFESFRRNND